MTGFEDIYVRYFRDVYRFVLSLSGSESTAEEITQETFFKALKGIKDFTGTCGVKVWLFQIAKNTYYTHCKKRNRLTPLPDDAPQNAPSVEEIVTDKAAAMELHAVLHALEEPYKEVFSLRVFGELPFAHIGQLFDKTENWARVTFYRAKKKIIGKMGGHHG